MTRMTGMTRNMKTSSDTGTVNKVSEKLSFLSLLLWDVEIKEIYCPYNTLNLFDIFLMDNMLTRFHEKINLCTDSFDTNQ
jgi:hypothetical protein